MEHLSLLFKALSEPLRLRIIQLLLSNGREAYGEELANALNVPAYQLSRHLKVLKTTGLIRERKEGRWVYYSLAKHNGNNRLLSTLRWLLAETASVERAAGSRVARGSAGRGTSIGSSRPVTAPTEAQRAIPSATSDARGAGGVR